MQVRLAIISNAGGSGKTTLSVHLAYELAKRRFKVALMDLDPQGSLTQILHHSQQGGCQGDENLKERA